MNQSKNDVIQKRHVQNTAIQLTLVFLMVYIVFNLTATVFYLIQGYEVYGPPGKNDSVYYHNQATLIAQTGDFSSVVLPYEYLVGSIYYIFGVNFGPFCFKIFMSIIASINVYLLISILGNICINNGITKKSFNKWTKILCMLVLVYPTYNYYILNMYRDVILVNGILMFIYTFIDIFIYKNKKRSNHIMFLISVLYVFIFRPYFGVLMIVTIILYVFLDKKYRTIKNVFALLIFILTAGILLKFTKYGLFGVNYLYKLANFSSIEAYRNLSSTGNLILNIDINFTNPIGFFPSYFYAFVVNHIYPFPNYFNNISTILFFPENLLITCLLISVLWNIKYKLTRYKELKFLLMYYLLNVGLIVGFSDNMGTNIRLRMSFVVCLFIMFFISQQTKFKVIQEDSVKAGID